jgi:hypothetical protein
VVFLVGEYMTKDPPDIITQAQLSVGSSLMENESMATRVCRLYMQGLQRRLALGGTIEPGPLIFKPDQLCVCHTYC